jgi:hypothetical protein
MIGDAHPCAACGAPSFDLASQTDVAALRFTLSRRTQLRAGLGAGIGAVIGFIHSAWLRGDTHDTHYLVMIAWCFGPAAFSALLRPRPIAALEDVLAARTGRGNQARRANFTMMAVCALVIIVDTGIVWYERASTMPRRDAERLVVRRTCQLAETCNKTVFCMGAELAVDLQFGHARVDRNDLDDCMSALDEIERTHAACSAPVPTACAAISHTTIPRLLEEAHAVERSIERDIEDELRKGLERAPAR